MTDDVLLALGGARSGKSRYAEFQARLTGLEKVYIAAAQAWDAEMAERIARHREDRAQDDWRTVEEPLGVPAAIMRESKPGRVVLVDCLTLWLSNLMGADRNVEASTAALLSALANARGPVILVSNEVGFGIVPDNAAARAFRDHAGRLHQQTAARASRVALLVAGVPVAVKGDPNGWGREFVDAG